jgi:hypothetical protein
VNAHIRAQKARQAEINAKNRQEIVASRVVTSVKTYAWTTFWFSAAAIATGAPSSALNAPSPELPPLSLSLSEKAKQTPFDPTAAQPLQVPVSLHHRQRLETPSYVSRMPIIGPKSAPDHMPIAVPDPSIDFKMIVKRPSVKSVP